LAQRTSGPVQIEYPGTGIAATSLWNWLSEERPSSGIRWTYVSREIETAFRLS
jgi:hypothetical protein